MGGAAVDILAAWQILFPAEVTHWASLLLLYGLLQLLLRGWLISSAAPFSTFPHSLNLNAHTPVSHDSTCVCGCTWAGQRGRPRTQKTTHNEVPVPRGSGLPQG